MDERLSTTEKLKSKILIDSLFTEGKSVPKYPIRLVYKELTTTNDSDQSAQIQVSFSVSKKRFKKAVDRNHIKRILREVYRKNKYLVLNTTDRKFIFMFLFVGKEQADFATLNKKMQKLMAKFIEKEEINTLP